MAVTEDSRSQRQHCLRPLRRWAGGDYLRAFCAEDCLRCTDQSLFVVPLDTVAVTASACALSRGPPARAPQLGACSATGKSSSVAETAQQIELTYPSSRRGFCGVSDASHRATHEEVGHGEP
jgi:hypothetical protein